MIENNIISSCRHRTRASETIAVKINCRGRFGSIEECRGGAVCRLGCARGEALSSSVRWRQNGRGNPSTGACWTRAERAWSNKYLFTSYLYRRVLGNLYIYYYIIIIIHPWRVLLMGAYIITHYINIFNSTYQYNLTFL